MRLSTSVNIFSLRRYRNWPELMPMAVAACKEAGFDAVDLYLKDCQDLPLPAQEAWMADMASRLALHDIPATQAHSYLINTRNLDEDGARDYLHKTLRSIQIAGQLRVPWLVVHLLCDADENASHTRNIRFIHQLESAMARYNVGIALENLRGTPYETAEQLLDIARRLDNPQRVGICWDTGHAHLVAGIDQSQSIRLLGNRLKCTHIQDNHGERDEHIMPFMGSVDWPPIVLALKESGYAGDFTYESAQPLKHLPDDDVLRMDFMRYTVRLGRYLLSL